MQPSKKFKKGNIKVNENDIMEIWWEYYKNLLNKVLNNAPEDSDIEESLGGNQDHQ